MRHHRQGLAPALRRLERHLGFDRRGRSTWVWAFPPLVGLAAGVLAPLAPGFGGLLGIAGQVAVGLFAFLSMTTIAFLYMLAFDRDRNQVDEQDTTWSGRIVKR